VEGNGFDEVPAADVTRPTFRMSRSGRFVKGFAPLQASLVLAAVALRRGHEAETAMAVFPVVPPPATGDPSTGALQTLERCLGTAVGVSLCS
jgi:hypothetical protein